jgi:hypothetical protein
MLIRSRNRDRSRGGSVALSSLATGYLNGVTPFHYADFITNRMLYAGADVGTVAGGTGYSFTRASDGYYTNADGTLTLFGSGALRRGDRGVLIEGSRTNLLLRSQEFDNASWTKVNATVTANATTAPDGTTTADLVQENNATGPHDVEQTSISITSGTTYAITVFAKAAGRDFIQISFFSVIGGATRYANFDLATGVVGSKGVDATSSIQLLANGWYRCVMTAAASSTANSGFFIATLTSANAARAESYTGDNTSGIFIWGAQLEAASFPSSYIPTVAAAATRAADSLSYTAGVSYPIQLWSEFERAVDTGTNEFVFVTDNNTSNERAVLRVSAADLGQLLITAGGAAQATIGATTLAINTVCKLAGRVNTNSAQLATNGTLGTEDTSVTLPTNPTLLRVGSDQAGAAQAFGYVRRLAVIQGAGTDANLIAMTS